jgi:23S rRNA (uracil1939-C5)-methyltransferase
VAASSSEPVEGRVRDLTHAGDAAIETARGIVLARGALPGERVTLRVTGKQRGTLRGELIEVLEPSPERVVAPCALADRCGGCPLMALSLPAQRAWKQAHLAKLLERAGSDVVPDVIAAPDALGYRTRARLGFRHAGGRTLVGYRAAHSATLLDVERCIVLAPPLAAGLDALRRTLAPELRGHGELLLAVGAGGRTVAAVLTRSPQPEAAYRAARALVEPLAEEGALAGVALRVGEGPRPAAAEAGDCRQHALGHDGVPLLAPVHAFAQANAVVNARLVARVAELAQPSGKRVLELFAGHGNLTVALGTAHALTALELQRDAVAALRENLRARGLTHVKVVEADAAQLPPGPVDVVVLDPPREGARNALAALCARDPERIVYVSCDPSTLARDLATLAAAGYRPDAASVVDMFPQTAHLESVVRLRRTVNAR